MSDANQPDFRENLIAIYESILRDASQELCLVIKKRVIRACQRDDAYMLGDSGLKSFWDEVCIIADEGDGYEYESCLDVLDGYIQAVLKEANLSDWQWMCLWLETSEGRDWLFHDDRVTDRKLTWDETGVIRLIRDNNVVPAALDWTNRRIRQYSESRYEVN
jgi:hypothetical protein